MGWTKTEHDFIATEDTLTNDSATPLRAQDGAAAISFVGVNVQVSKSFGVIMRAGADADERHLATETCSKPARSLSASICSSRWRACRPGTSRWNAAVERRRPRPRSTRFVARHRA